MRTTKFELVIDEIKNRIIGQHLTCTKERNKLLNRYIKNINTPENYDTFHKNMKSIEDLSTQEETICKLWRMKGVWVEYLKVFYEYFSTQTKELGYDIEYDIDSVLGGFLIYINDEVTVSVYFDSVGDILAGNQENVTDTCLRFGSNIIITDSSGEEEIYNFQKHKISVWDKGTNTMIMRLVSGIQEAMTYVKGADQNELFGDKEA